VNVSVLDLFRIGPGPSSSHTVGPMVAADTFARQLVRAGEMPRVARVQVDLLGSLGATGPGHGTDAAVIAGLTGQDPRTADSDRVHALVSQARSGRLRMAGGHEVAFGEGDVRLLPEQNHPGHPNAVRLRALDVTGREIAQRTFLSVGGGFIRDADTATDDQATERAAPPAPFGSAGALLEWCRALDCPISEVVRRNEHSWHGTATVRAHLDEVWDAMRACVQTGLHTHGNLPGPLGVRRRAPQLAERLANSPTGDPLHALDWVSTWAISVNEQNASGALVVTAPTNGAAGVVPAVAHYLTRYHPQVADVHRFLLAAAAIGAIVKNTASISGAEVGCQGEVGTASAMAAAGLTEVLGGTPAQVEHAAEIALEHHLGLTCDPVGGLVQIPCIERNAIGAAKAIQSSRLALAGDGTHRVSLDDAVETMRRTGADMHDDYKETARGGLALTVVAC
jgi:L-serine dehydratase